MEGDDEDRPLATAANALVNEFKSMREKMKADDDDEFSGKNDYFIFCSVDLF